MSDALLLAVRHCSWANAKLLEFCAALSEEQLASTSPGTFGTIHGTLAHLVAGEVYYLDRLTGEIPGGELSEDPPAPLDELVSRERSNAVRIERIVANAFDPTRVLTRPARRTATAGILVAQYVHHGSDHRAHVGTILGARGLGPPELDVWAYGASIGVVRPGAAT